MSRLRFEMFFCALLLAGLIYRAFFVGSSVIDIFVTIVFYIWVTDIRYRYKKGKMP
jgi:hypothetical protein